MRSRNRTFTARFAPVSLALGPVLAWGLVSALLPGSPAAGATPPVPPAAAQQDAAPAPPGAGPLRFPDQIDDPIVATIFSFPTDYFYPGEVAHFLEAVRHWAPGQDLVALADPAMRTALEKPAKALGVTLVDTGDHVLSPWPRDPFSVALDPSGGLVLVNRPNQQRTREGDRAMASVLADGLPERLVRKWGGVRSWRAPLPFHNGHVLMAGGDAWISLHSLEPRILEILGVDRVPVETFRSSAGIARYVEAADRAADELGGLYGKPVRFVHPLPRSGPAAERAALMYRIGGGAGFDLDSVVTLLPDGAGQDHAGNRAEGDGHRLQALVASTAEGRQLLAGLDADGWRTLAATYDLELPKEGPPAAILSYQETSRVAQLGEFLDLVAEHLADTGMTVRRLPLALIPLSSVRGAEGLEQPDFVLGWNNVVLERRAGGPEAAGFASGLAAADRAARATYAAAGTRLELLPTLPSSVINNGGFRCASNQVRRPADQPPATLQSRRQPLR